jgi:hypothetical protein
MSDTERPDLVPPVVANFGQPELEPEDQVDPTVADAGDDGDAGLSAREVKFCDLLATGTPPAEAARAVGIAERSGRRWRKKPEIIEAVRVRLSENIATGKSILAAGMAKAARALVEMSDGAEEADAARVSACRAVTESAVKLVELDELQTRLALLEAQLASSGGKPRWT